MGLKDWRTKHSMRDPVRGQFQVTGRYDAHPNGSSFRDVLTGVVSGPGVAPTAGEHLADIDGRWVGRDTLPVTIDRAEPTKFVVLWDEVPKPDFRAQARAQAQQAADAARGGQVPMAKAAPTEIHVEGGDRPDGSTPEWATEMVADLARRGLIPGGTVGSIDVQAPITVQLPDQVVHLTAGRVSAGEAAQLIATGRPAEAVLLSVTDVAVPQQALPGPTASLCDLTLRVKPANDASFVAVTRLGFRSAERRAAIAVVGATLPVRIDPADHSRVVVDSVAWDAQHGQ